MRKILLCFLCIIFLSGSALEFQEEADIFDINSLYDYQKAFKSEEVIPCSCNKTKTYMDYRMITSTSSTQYKYIHNYMTVDEETGFLYDDDGFIGVALGSYYGIIGDRYYFTLDSGVVLPLVKVEEKADGDTDSSGCYHTGDGSVIEFVIDKQAAEAYFGRYGNGLVLSGNYNNYDLFKGEIVKVEKVLDEPNPDYVVYVRDDVIDFDNYDIFNYASGY